MFIIDDLIVLGGLALATALAVIALVVKAFLIAVAISAFIGLIKKIGSRIAVVRKRKALEKLKELAEKNGQEDIAREIEKIREAGEALLTPVDGDMSEEWEKVKVIQAEDPNQDDMTDAFMFADTGRVKVL